MDPDNQALIKRIVEERGADDLVVMLGAADAEAVEVAAETVRDGDPAWVGPLAGVQLGLPVLHVFEDVVREQADDVVYEAQIGFFEMTLDVDQVRKRCDALVATRDASSRVTGDRSSGRASVAPARSGATRRLDRRCRARSTGRRPAAL